MDRYLDRLATKHSSIKREGKKGYAKLYQKRFSQNRLKPIKILEIGMGAGGCIRMWMEYFPKSQIHCLDNCTDPAIKSNVRLTAILQDLDRCGDFHFHKGDQTSAKALHSLVVEGDFDLIIDSGSNKSSSQQFSLGILYTALKEGGVYVIENMSSKEDALLEDMSQPTDSVIKTFAKQGKYSATIGGQVADSSLNGWESSVEIHNDIAFITKGKKKKVVVVEKAVEPEEKVPVTATKKTKKKQTRRKK